MDERYDFLYVRFYIKQNKYKKIIPSYIVVKPQEKKVKKYVELEVKDCLQIKIFGLTSNFLMPHESQKSV